MLVARKKTGARRSKLRVRVIHSASGKSVFLADERLVGKKFVEGGVCLNIDANFYTERVEADGISQLLEGAIMVYAVGEAAVAELRALKLIKEEGVRFVCGIPHLMLFVSPIRSRRW